MASSPTPESLPKVVMTLLVRNEADLIADNLLFHWGLGISQFIVMDNGSTDGTQSIIKELAQQIPIELLHQKADDYAQAEWVTAMAQQARRIYKADWVINNDADEFWVFPPKGAPTYLGSVDAEIVKVFVQRHNAVLRARTDPWSGSSSHPASTELFERLSLNSLDKRLPPKCMHRGSIQVTVHQGNHDVDNLPGRCYHASHRAHTSAGDPYILHYPYRSFRSYKRKIFLGGAAYSRNNKLPMKVGKTWRQQFKLLEQQGLESFWANLHRNQSEIDVAELSGSIWHDYSVLEAVQQNRVRWQKQQLAKAFDQFLAGTRQTVEQQMQILLEKLQNQRGEVALSLAHHNFSFVVAGLRQHMRTVQGLGYELQLEKICGCFAKLRDLASLYPENRHLLTFLRRLLELKQADAVHELREDLAGKRILLHLSCIARLKNAQASRKSFEGFDNAVQSLIVVGETTLNSSECDQLGFRYCQGVLYVPVSDHYEHLSSKLFYTLLLLNLILEPAQLVKLDDDLRLDDESVFGDYLNELQRQQIAYAGWRVALPHHKQWHGWHVGKCSEPMLDQRGYQYPLPSSYAAGGFGYVLGRQGLEACAAMFLGMRSFFEQPCVQLEDAFVGMAIEQRGLSLRACNHMRKTPLSVSDAALPGLRRVTKDRYMLST